MYMVSSLFLWKLVSKLVFILFPEFIPGNPDSRNKIGNGYYLEGVAELWISIHPSAQHSFDLELSLACSHFPLLSHEDQRDINVWVVRACWASSTFSYSGAHTFFSEKVTDDTQITHRYIKACFLLSSHRLRNLSLVSGPLVAVLNWAVTVATVEHDRLRKGNGSQLGSPSLSFVGFLLFFFYIYACMQACIYVHRGPQATFRNWFFPTVCVLGFCSGCQVASTLTWWTILLSLMWGIFTRVL